MTIRQQINREEFDYPTLMSALARYTNPRSKVTSLLRRGEIIRVKKGLYVFGDMHRRRPYSRPLLANLIYGPSYVSIDWALSFHGLIPERVETVTSVTTLRPRSFDTPVGRFVYRQVPDRSFHVGMDRVEEGEVAFLIATPERALADKVRDDRGHPLRTQKEAEQYLFDDLRIDRERFLGMNAEMLSHLATQLRSRKVEVCAQLLRSRKGGR